MAYKKLTDEERLKIVEAAKFKSKWLFKSEGERIVFKVMREICRELHLPDFYVMAQVSLGELFESENNDDAWRLINWMRCDLALFSTEGRLCLIVEVDGKGHDPVNDRIKRHVCESSDIRFQALTGGELPSTIRAILSNKLAGGPPL